MATTQQNNRILSLDIIKCLAIFLVLWGHAIQHLLESPAQDNYLFRFISSFHMPLFMSIAGFFAVSAHKHPPVKFLLRKGMELVLPAVTMSIILVAVRWMMQGCAGMPDMSGFSGWFWFLKSLFICFLMYVVAIRFGKFTWVAIAGMLLISQCIGFCGVNRMFPFFVTGIILRRLFPAIQARSGYVAAASGILFILMLTGWDARYFGVPGGFHPLMDFIAGRNPGYAWHNLYMFLIGCAGTIFMLAGTDLLTRKATHIPGIQTISRIGQNTKGIYILQVIILENVAASFFKMDYLHSEVFNWILSPLLSLGVLYLCMLISGILRKNRVIALLTLGDIPKNTHPGKEEGVKNNCCR